MASDVTATNRRLFARPYLYGRIDVSGATSAPCVANLPKLKERHTNLFVYIFVPRR